MSKANVNTIGVINPGHTSNTLTIFAGVNLTLENNYQFNNFVLGCNSSITVNGKKISNSMQEVVSFNHQEFQEFLDQIPAGIESVIIGNLDQ